MKVPEIHEIKQIPEIKEIPQIKFYDFTKQSQNYKKALDLEKGKQ